MVMISTYLSLGVYVPYLFTFGIPTSIIGYVGEGVLCMIYFIDFYVNFKTQRENADGPMTKHESREHYYKREFTLDVFSTIPFSLIFYGVSTPVYIPGLFKILTLLKGYRVLYLLRRFRQSYKLGGIASTVISSFAITLIVNNVMACLMYYIALLEYKKSWS